MPSHARVEEQRDIIGSVATVLLTPTTLHSMKSIRFPDPKERERDNERLRIES